MGIYNIEGLLFGDIIKIKNTRIIIQLLGENFGETINAFVERPYPDNRVQILVYDKRFNHYIRYRIDTESVLELIDSPVQRLWKEYGTNEAEGLGGGRIIRPGLIIPKTGDTLMFPTFDDSDYILTIESGNEISKEISDPGADPIIVLEAMQVIVVSKKTPQKIKYRYLEIWPYIIRRDGI